jgi:hypothetical protein
LLVADEITAQQGTLPTADEVAEVIAVAWAADALSERVVVALAGAVVAAAEQLNEELLVELS